MCEEKCEGKRQRVVRVCVWKERKRGKERQKPKSIRCCENRASARASRLKGS